MLLSRVFFLASFVFLFYVSGGRATADTWAQQLSLEQQELRDLLYKREFNLQEREILTTYLDSMSMGLDNNLSAQLVLLEQTYKLCCDRCRSETTKRCLFYDVLGALNGHDYVLAQCFHVLQRLPVNNDSDYSELVRKYDHFTRYQPGDERAQAELIDIMLERMSYAAVLEYCDRRIGDGDDYYRELRAVLRLLMLQEAIDSGGIEYHIQQIKKTAKPEDYGKTVFTEEFLREEAFQRYSTDYDPTVVEPTQVDLLIEEMLEDPSREAGRIERYSGLAVVAYKMSHGREDAVRSYLSRASELVGSEDAKFSGTNAPEEGEVARRASMQRLTEKVREFEEVAAKYAGKKRTGTHGRMMDRESFVFEISLQKRWEYARDHEKRGEQLNYLSYADVFEE